MIKQGLFKICRLKVWVIWSWLLAGHVHVGGPSLVTILRMRIRVSSCLRVVPARVVLGAMVAEVACVTFRPDAVSAIALAAIISFSAHTSLVMN